MNDQTPNPVTNDAPGTQPDGGLEAQLAELSAPIVAGPAIWQYALKQHHAVKAKSFWRPQMSRRFQIVAACAALAAIAGGTLILPSLGSARGSHRVADAPDSKVPATMRMPATAPEVPEMTYSFASDSASDVGLRVQLERRVELPSAAAIATQDVRAVVHKSAIEIQSPDVRAAYAKAAIIPSDALGEFTENSNLVGEGSNTRGELTLRVRASRLSAALNDVRALGLVASESTNAVDVTDRIVDLDATIRNEKKVEAELLGLLEGKQDAPVKQILEIRQSLSDARDRIEKLEAQRANTGRAVEFATILVVVRHAEPPAVPEVPKSIGQQFNDELGNAWHAGVTNLGSSLGWCLRVFVGGLPVWIGMVIAGAMGTVVVRRLTRWSVAEPAPKWSTS
jgi:hypothetical protein